MNSDELDLNFICGCRCTSPADISLPCDKCKTKECPVCQDIFNYKELEMTICLCLICIKCTKELVRDIVDKATPVCIICNTIYPEWTESIIKKIYDNSDYDVKSEDQLPELTVRTKFLWSTKIKKLERDVESAKTDVRIINRARKTFIDELEKQEASIDKLKDCLKRMREEYEEQVNICLKHNKILLTDTKNNLESVKKAVGINYSPYAPLKHKLVARHSLNANHLASCQLNDKPMRLPNHVIVPATPPRLMIFFDNKKEYLDLTQNFSVSALNAPAVIWDYENLQGLNKRSSISDKMICLPTGPNSWFSVYFSEKTIDYYETFPPRVVKVNPFNTNYPRIFYSDTQYITDVEQNFMLHNAYYGFSENLIVCGTINSRSNPSTHRIGMHEVSVVKKELLGFSWPDCMVTNERKKPMLCFVRAQEVYHSFTISEVKITERYCFPRKNYLNPDKLNIVRCAPYGPCSVLVHLALDEDTYCLCLYENVVLPRTEIIYKLTYVFKNIDNANTRYVLFANNYVIAVKRSADEFLRLYRIDSSNPDELQLVKTYTRPHGLDESVITQAWVGVGGRLNITTKSFTIVY